MEHFFRFIFLLLLFIVSGCSSHYILIKENGTAHVEISLFEQKNDDLASKDSINNNYSKEDLGNYQLAINELYSSELISNFQFDSLNNGSNVERISYDISNVDSLGSYLDPLFGTYFDFKLTDDKLIITGPDGVSNPEDDITGMTNMLEIKAIIAFEKEIKKIITPNDYIKKIDNNTIEINTSVGEMNYNGIGNLIEIIFK